MTSYHRMITIGPWIATSVFVVVFFFDSMSSAGIDLADHNAVVNRLFDHWGMHAITEDLYSVYHSYPILSHIAAAVLGLLLSSPLAGVQLLTLLSLIALWSGLALILQTLPCRMRALIGTGFVLLLIFNRSIVKLELHGNEIIGYSFLFPQLVGQAFAIVIVASQLSLSEMKTIQPSGMFFWRRQFRLQKHFTWCRQLNSSASYCF